LKYYSPEEIGRQYNVKPVTVRKWIREGKLKALRLGGLWRISEEQLQEFITAGQSEGRAQEEEEEPDQRHKSEAERRLHVQAGQAVVANMRKGKDENLIKWARDKGLFVRIDRASKWGNKDDRQGEKYRQEVCKSFIKQYAESETMQAEIGELKGKVLGCWCYPKMCHGDYLAAQANEKGLDKQDTNQILMDWIKGKI